MNEEIVHPEMFYLILSKYGIREIPGVENNPEIVNFFQEIGQTWIQDDETAWCSALINWAAKKTGYEYTGKLNARSWLDIGTPIIKPILGCVVVFWRVDPNSWQGHVGLYVRHDNNYIWTLGGNQSNMLQISAYNKDQKLGYRLLSKV